MALLSVHFLKRILTEHKRTNERLTKLSDQQSKLTEQISKNHEVLLDLAREDFPNLETSYKRIVKTDAEQLNISRVSIWLFNSDHTEITCQCMYQKGEIIDQDEMTLSANQFPHYFEALERSRIISANDAQDDPRTSEFSKDYLAPLGITSMMDVPIRLQGKMIGIVCHEHIGPMREWSMQDEDFATSISDMCALTIQIAERKQAEETLQVSNERFSASFTYANIGMALVSLDHSIIEANQAFCEMLGYSKGLLTGIFFNDITHPDDFDTSFDYHHKLITGEIDNYNFEKRYLHKQGHEIWTLLNVSLVRDKDSIPIYTIAQIQDITERKQAEKALQDSEERFRALFDNNPHMLFGVDKYGKVLSVNQFGIEQLGYSKAQLVGKSVTNVFYEEDRVLAEEAQVFCRTK
jgi:PAS domain S-box-containing protein